jgi:hypothetical protein
MSPTAQTRWPWCMCPPPSGQARLFESGAYQVRYDWSWPEVVTGGGGRPGFWRRRCPDVFGERRGVGPLIICPDTNVLVWIVENLDVVDESFGVPAGPWIADSWNSPLEGLRDLVGLWFWRDVRFYVSELHLADDPGRILPERLRARRIAVDSLGTDFVQRGAFEIMLDPGVEPQDSPCPVHGDVADVLPQKEPRWPRPPRDRALARDAHSSGCHVLLSEDRDMLRCHSSLFASGMAVLRPVELLKALDTAGELEPLGGDRPYPDTATLARFYSLRSPQHA